MWQEYGNNLVGKPIFLTWFEDDGTHETQRLAEDNHNPWLAGATSDNDGQIYYLEIQDVTQWISNELMGGWTVGPTEPCQAWIVHWDTQRNKQQFRRELPSDAMLLNDFTENTAALRYDPINNNIGVYFSHRMFRSSDGLNHQRGLGFVFDVDRMEITGAGHYQTGSHSFQNSMIAAPTGGFIGLELDDGSPRGLQVIKMDAHNKDLGFTPYMFKTRHGSGPENPAGSSFPVYPEISVNGNTFYKWSNDNQVYTVLAQPGIVEVSDGYLIFFAGERPPLDSSAMETHEQTVQSPRNLGWVKIGKNIAAKGVLSGGATETETGGFYGFRGEWTSQSHRGIKWLTNYEHKWLIMNKPKSVRLAPNRILLMWEQWLSRPMTEADCREIAADVDFCISVVTADWYDRSSDWREQIIRTELMIVDDSVHIVKPLWAMEGGLLTPQGDAPRVIDGCAIIYAGRGRSIKRWKVCEVECAKEVDSTHEFVLVSSVELPTDDPCFQPFPPNPDTCFDSVDAGGGKGYGPTRCQASCRPALCHEVPHFCSSTAQYCPLTCGHCSADENRGYNATEQALVDFLKSCEVGSVTHGIHEYRVPAEERQVTRFRQTYDGACPPERPSGGAADATTSGGASLGGEGGFLSSNMTTTTTVTTMSRTWGVALMNGASTNVVGAMLMTLVLVQLHLPNS